MAKETKEKEGEVIHVPQISAETSTRLRDIEEKQRLLKDRLLLFGESLVEEREKTFSDIQEMKADLIKLKDETQRAKDLLQRITEQVSNLARKEELMILQRQFDLFRKT
jgi:hypothetical protein